MSTDPSELTKSRLAGLLVALARRPRLRARAVTLAIRLEGGQLRSLTARRLLAEHYGVEVGAYSYGPCMVPHQFPPGVEVGRYTSIGPGVRVFRRNHPIERPSMHPYFYNSELGVVRSDTISSTPLIIGSDVWIGADAIITPGCSRIGHGAVIGAGSVVTQDVDHYAIAVGSPARVVRSRFSPVEVNRLLHEHWWDWTLDECRSHLDYLLRPVSQD